MKQGADQGSAAGAAADAGFRRLYDRFAPAGLRYACARLHDRGGAEDLVQEAFCRLSAHWHRAGPEAFGALFFTTLHNLVIDVLRARRRPAPKPLDEADLPAVDAANPSDPAGSGLEQRVRTLLSGLPAHLADALELKVNGGLSYDQIAGVLGCSHAQVRTWIYRARRQLEAALHRECARQEERA